MSEQRQERLEPPHVGCYEGIERPAAEDAPPALTFPIRAVPLLRC